MKTSFQKQFLLVGLLTLIVCCKKASSPKELDVYNNNFESEDLRHISGGNILVYNGSKCLGNYNNEGFKLSLSSLPKHHLLKISFDLYVIGSWDGNKEIPDGPDIWSLQLDEMPLIYTTFSNQECIPGDLCSPQSYPLNYPNFNNNPRAGAIAVGLPIFCGMSPGSTTTLYHIEKIIEHNHSSLNLQCSDKLIQLNAADKKCDESWALDNLIIKSIEL